MFLDRYYQEECADNCFNSMLKGNNPIGALPTGSGKTAVISRLVDLIINANPRANITIISSSKEIIGQVHGALSKVYDPFPIGLWANSFKSKTKKQITVAQIQSAFRKPEKFIPTDVFIVDECHDVGFDEKSMYQKLFGIFKEADASFIGLTATPYRTGYGYIYKGKDALFNDLACDYTTGEKYLRLVNEGYLSPIYSRPTSTIFDTKDIPMLGGDFNQKKSAQKFGREWITRAAIMEIVYTGRTCGYKRWLLFAIDIKHAELISGILTEMDVTNAVIHSKMDEDRDEVLLNSRNGAYQALINVDVLTTGYDDPAIDLVGMLRPTNSPIIHVQAPGRGGRPLYADGFDLNTIEGRLAAIAAGPKQHCLLLDFGGNTERLGPINEVVVRQKSDGDDVNEVGKAPVKTCPECNTYNHAPAKICIYCRYIFPVIEKLTIESSKAEVVVDKKAEKEQKKIEASLLPTSGQHWMSVDEITYVHHRPFGKKPMMKVQYKCGFTTYNDYICYEHDGYAGQAASKWVARRLPDGAKMPKSTKELYERASELDVACNIKVDFDSKYKNIIDCELYVDESASEMMSMAMRK